MSIKIGISPIAWQNDDLPELTADFTMEQALRESREIGYTGIERGRRMPQDTQGLRIYLEQFDLALCGGWCSGNLLQNSVEEEIAAIRDQVNQFVQLNAPCIVYAECSNTVQGQLNTPVSQRPRFSKHDVMAYARKLGEVAKWTADQGLALSYHHHMGSIVEDQDDVDALMQGSSKELNLLFDTGHLHFAGASVLDTLDRWGDRVQHVHFKDVRADVLETIKHNDSSFLESVVAGAFTVPGDKDGCIDFQAVANKLKQIDYSGWIVVEAEQDPAKAPPYENSKLGYEHIISVCESSGLLINTEK